MILPDQGFSNIFKVGESLDANVTSVESNIESITSMSTLLQYLFSINVARPEQERISINLCMTDGTYTIQDLIMIFDYFDSTITGDIAFGCLTTGAHMMSNTLLGFTCKLHDGKITACNDITIPELNKSNEVALTFNKEPGQIFTKNFENVRFDEIFITDSNSLKEFKDLILEYRSKNFNKKLVIYTLFDSYNEERNLGRIEVNEAISERTSNFNIGLTLNTGIDQLLLYLNISTLTDGTVNKDSNVTIRRYKMSVS